MPGSTYAQLLSKCITRKKQKIIGLIKIRMYLVCPTKNIRIILSNEIGCFHGNNSFFTLPGITQVSANLSFTLKLLGLFHPEIPLLMFRHFELPEKRLTFLIPR